MAMSRYPSPSRSPMTARESPKWVAVESTVRSAESGSAAKPVFP